VAVLISWTRADRHGLQSASSAGMMAGFSMAVVSTPIDVVKTRIMNRSAGGPAPYRGMFDCLVKVLVTRQIVRPYWDCN